MDTRTIRHYAESLTNDLGSLREQLGEIVTDPSRRHGPETVTMFRATANLLNKAQVLLDEVNGGACDVCGQPCDRCNNEANSAAATAVSR